MYKKNYTPWPSGICNAGSTFENQLMQSITPGLKKKKSHDRMILLIDAEKHLTKSNIHS